LPCSYRRLLPQRADKRLLWFSPAWLSARAVSQSGFVVASSLCGLCPFYEAGPVKG
jgi:hypothetical protein